VPQLGGIDGSKEEVEGFYDFWYNFDSWRSFEYLDKEVNEGSESRDDKRFVEKKNKTERARRKKEDIARVRGLVDKALGLDPRIARIKRDEKAARDAKKKGKANASGTATPVLSPQQKAEEERKKAEEEAKKKEEEEKVCLVTSKTCHRSLTDSCRQRRTRRRQKLRLRMPQRRPAVPNVPAASSKRCMYPPDFGFVVDRMPAVFITISARYRHLQPRRKSRIYSRPT